VGLPDARRPCMERRQRIGTVAIEIDVFMSYGVTMERITAGNV